MFRYISKRVFATVPVMAIVVVLVFLMLRLSAADPAAIDNVDAFKAKMDTFSAPNPYMKGDAVMQYVGTTSFGQKRQVSVPLVVNEFKDGAFQTMFVAQVD